MTIMTTAVICACNGAALSQQLPNQIDLKAAYCLPIARYWLGKIQNENTEKWSVEAQKLWTTGLQTQSATVRRMEHYLVPRISDLDAVSIALASQSGQEDITRFQRTVNACIARCAIDRRDEFPACTRACGDENGVVLRMRTCNNASWLPF